MCVAVDCVQTSANGHNEDLIMLISFHLLTTFLLKLFGLIQLILNLNSHQAGVITLSG